MAYTWCSNTPCYSSNSSLRVFYQFDPKTGYNNQIGCCSV
ncbi:hypothetical protein J2Z69_001988 [Paenibacillus shirakamiensis]|uniref:Uncharacterized protein n=1 Tax=Paenibacillus shirakamiensis TaxID=1265935 RepID=A0ABS4JGU8_9BACL|nr:hypothetical protein [Paenibacillus shirakamiensis]